MEALAHARVMLCVRIAVSPRRIMEMRRRGGGGGGGWCSALRPLWIRVGCIQHSTQIHPSIPRVINSFPSKPNSWGMWEWVGLGFGPLTLRLILIEANLINWEGGGSFSTKVNQTWYSTADASPFSSRVRVLCSCSHFERSGGVGVLVLLCNCQAHRMGLTD